MIIGIANSIGQRWGGGVILPFEFTIDTNNTSTGSSASNQFKLPLVSSLPLNAVVDWGDGNTDTITVWNQAETTHTYASAGTYTVSITGDLSGWQFNNGGDRLKMLNVVSWGALNISVDSGFYGCSNMTSTASDVPTITSTSLALYFESTKFNGELNYWDVSGVSNFSRMFRLASFFNKPLDLWDMSSATNLQTMFAYSSFNQNINSWNVSNVTNFTNTLAYCSFNQPLNLWTLNTLQPVNLQGMFESNNAFNQNIGSWNTQAVTNMRYMFDDCPTFNNGGSNSIGSWNTSAVTQMTNMFFNATSFNQDISDWDVNQVSNFTNFMTSVTLSTTNYDLLLVDWEANLQSAYPGGVGYPFTISISFGGSKYTLGSSAATARASLISNFGWTITDGGGI